MAFLSSLNFLVIFFALICFVSNVAGQCNPLKTACPGLPALATSTYYLDFTQQTNSPPDWTVANYESVAYGPNGAEFTFQKRYDAPYIWSNFYLLFGRVETVVQAAPGAGIISSSVLISDDLDEIDWEWSGNDFGTSSGKVQTNYYGKGITGNYDRGTQPSINSPQTTFHTYAVDWTPTSLTWSVDGTAIRTLQNNNAETGAYQYPQTPMHLQLGLWDGGDADSAGGYTNLSQAPFTMYVKSVKITTPNPCLGTWQYMDTSGSTGSVKCVLNSVSSAGSTNSTTSSQTSITVIPALISASSVSISPGPLVTTTYTIVSGDTGYGIANKLGVSFTSLAASNPNVNWDLLLIGQVLQVLAAASTRPPSTFGAVSSNVVISTAASSSGVTSGSGTPLSATQKASIALNTAASPVTSSVSMAKSFLSMATSSMAAYTSSSISSTFPDTGPSSTDLLTPPLAFPFSYVSCNTDNNVGARALNSLSTSSNQMTVAMCASFCSSYVYMGLEYGRECYCGNALVHGSASTTDGRCSMVCSGDSAQICGGSYGLSLYRISANAGDLQTLSGSGSVAVRATTVTTTVTTTVCACPAGSVR